MTKRLVSVQRPLVAVAYRLSSGDGMTSIRVGNWRDMPIKTNAQKEIDRFGWNVEYAYRNGRRKPRA